MADSVIQKAIALILLIVTGYLLKQKFQDPISTGAIRNFILNVALPATIFLSTIEIDTQLDLILLPSFALAVNLFLMAIGFLITHLLMQNETQEKKRALILLFPSLAPGLTVYPFIEQFLGRQGLAWVALADMGNKTFVLVGLYALAIYWFYQLSNQKSGSKVNAQWGNIGKFLLTEPVNIAIVLGFILATFKINSASLPLALTDTIQKLAVCATPLILFYVGITLNFKSFQFGKLLTILLAKAGCGFLFSGVAIVLLRPTSPEAISLFVSLPQASFSLWPLLHATRINNQKPSISSEQGSSKALFFDTEFATAMLATSFPFSILILLLIFSSGRYFYTPHHLLATGSFLLGVFGLLIISQRLPVQLQNPIQVQVQLRNPLLVKSDPVRESPLQSTPITEPENGHFQASELTTPNPDPSETHLDRLDHIIRRYLAKEMDDRTLAFQLQYLVKGRVLLVVGQHNPGITIQFEKKLSLLEEEVKLLNLDHLDHIRVYFRTHCEKRPYGGYSIALNSALPQPSVARA